MAKRKKKIKLPPPHLVQVKHNLKAGDEVTFLKHIQHTLYKKGDVGVVSRIDPCVYATGGWMVYLKDMHPNVPGFSIYCFIEKEVPSKWSGNVQD